MDFDSIKPFYKLGPARVGDQENAVALVDEAMNKALQKRAEGIE